MANVMTERQWQKYIVNRPTAYEPASLAAYNAATATFSDIGLMAMANKLPPQDEIDKMSEAAEQARLALVQVADPESVCWYIWHGNVPKADDADSYDFSNAFDFGDFEPFLLPYLLPDQNNVKGNMIVIAGGGFQGRMNTYEGYPVAERFNKLGYNAFVLQRRVAPYLPVDAMLDLARSIRYLRALGPEKGLGGLDCIAAVGFSGGSSTILGQMATCYGHILPSEVHPSYVPDNIDEQSADLDVALCIYGPAWDYRDMSGHYETENPNLPPIFICTGSKDEAGASIPSTELFRSLNDITTTELHLFAGAGHGFGLGPREDPKAQRMKIPQTVSIWPELADNFIQCHVIGKA